MAWDLAIPIIDLGSNLAFAIASIFEKNTRKDSKEKTQNAGSQSQKLPRESLEKLSSPDNQNQGESDTDNSQPKIEGLLSKIFKMFT